MATLPLLPKATAVWLVENTTLTFEQISEFCGMHLLEIQGIADGEVANNVIGKDPIAAKQLSRDEITRCEENSKATLRMLEQTRDYIEAKKKQVRGKSRYTPVARRQDKPDAIAWLLKNAQGIKDSQIIKLVGTTKKTIAGLRDRSHWNYANIKPRDPVLLGLCSQYDLDAAFAKLTPVKEEGKDKPQDTPSDASASE